MRGDSRDSGYSRDGSREGREGREGREFREPREGREFRNTRESAKKQKGPNGKFIRFLIDYKDPLALGRYVTDGGKVTPARISKLNIASQKRVVEAVKRARNLALVPSGTDAYDSNHRPEAISPAPFDLQAK